MTKCKCIHPTCVVEVAGPLVVVGQLGKDRLGHELLSLVVQVVLQVVPQQQVQKGGLAVGIMAQGRRPQTRVQETE